MAPYPPYPTAPDSHKRLPRGTVGFVCSSGQSHWSAFEDSGSRHRHPAIATCSSGVNEEFGQFSQRFKSFSNVSIPTLPGMVLVSDRNDVWRDRLSETLPIIRRLHMV
jgi:hypothetical protein